MADSLDDFFAKKDKKRKNKNQTAALSAEALVRELEEGSKKSEYSSRREGKTSAALEILGLGADDNDWKDFEEVEKRDYTGLKLKEMSIQDQDEEQRRLIDQTELVPETIAWKSKEDTVAAIISARTDPNQISDDPVEQKQEEPSTDTKPDPAATVPSSTPSATTDSVSSSAENNASKAAPDSSELDNQEPTEANAEPNQANAEKADESSEGDAAKKEGDSKPAVKKAYVLPQERLEKECKVLEPIRLGKLKSTTSRLGAQINIGDEKAFPSLG